jgi:hypothetical protein
MNDLTDTVRAIRAIRAQDTVDEPLLIARELLAHIVLIPVASWPLHAEGANLFQDADDLQWRAIPVVAASDRDLDAAVQEVISAWIDELDVTFEAAIQSAMQLRTDRSTAEAVA